MDNPWSQLSKCGSNWQPSAETTAAAVASAPVSQLQPPDSSRNSMISPSQYPHVVQEPCSSTYKIMAEPLFPFATNSYLYNSIHSVLGTSFSPLLSGAPSFLQCESQQMSSLKPFNPCSKVHIHRSNSVVGPIGREVSYASPEFSLQNTDNRYLKSRVVPTRTLGGDGGSPTSCLHDVVHSRKVNNPRLELDKVANYQTLYGIEQVNGFSSLEAAPVSSPTRSQKGKLQSSSCQAVPKLLHTCSSIPNQSSPLASGFPRVFCLYASGDLRLSSNGLLGVVCSCHGFQMSVSKFMEHSGLRNVNPGDAVHMDSGETIAQWRKGYLCKFGIRIPEDHCGWDWPEGFSTAADLLKSSGRVLNASNISDPFNSIGSPKAFIASKQALNNVELSDNPHSGQKLVNEILCHELKMQNSGKLLNGFSDTSQSIMRTGTANKNIDLPVSRFSTSKLVGGSDKDFKIIPTYIDPISKTNNSLTSPKNRQTLRSLSKDSDILSFNNLRDGEILGKVTVPSNIELRLGQPSQQSKKLGRSNVPGSNTYLANRLDHSSEPQIQNESSRITEKSRQYVDCAAQAAKVSSAKEQNQSKFANLGFGAYSTKVACQPKPLKNDVVAGSVTSMLFSHLESPKDKIQPNCPPSAARFTFNHPEAISSLEVGEHIDCCSMRPTTSHPLTPIQPFPSRALPTIDSSMDKNSSPKRTSMSSKEELTRVTPYLLEQNSQMLSLRQAVDSSNQKRVPSSCRFNMDQKILANPLYESIKSSIGLQSKSIGRNGCRFPSKDDPPELAVRSVPSGFTHWVGASADNSAVVTAVSGETSLQVKDNRVQHNLLCDLHQNGPPLPRIDKSANNSSPDQGKCCRSTYIPNQCSYSVQENRLNEDCNHKGKKLLSTFEEQSQIRASVLSASNLGKVCTSFGSKFVSPCKIGETTKPSLRSAESNAFQWKDVPSKTSGRCQISDVVPKGFNQSVQKSDGVKEQIMSNISSKCSVLDIAQASIKASNGDSCTDDANFAVDEGSGIQKNSSSDDALDSGSNIKFDGFACRINSNNEALSKAISDRSTCSLIDELRIIDSLASKKVQHEVHTSSMQDFEKDFETGKREKQGKFKILGTSFPESPISSVSYGSSGQSSQSLEDLPLRVRPSQERSHNCTRSIRHSFKRRSVWSAPSTGCCEDVHRLDKSTEQCSCQTPSWAYNEPKASLEKKIKLDGSFSKTEHVELTMEINSVQHKIDTSSQQVNVCKRITRPVVCGRYGVILNGDTSKPAKIFSLGKILKVARRCDPALNKVLKKSPAKTLKKSIIREGDRRSARISNFKESKDYTNRGTAVCTDFDPMDTLEEIEAACSPRWTKEADASHMLLKGKNHINGKSNGIALTACDLGTKIKRKSKEIRKRSIHELITEGEDYSFVSFPSNKPAIPQDYLKTSEDNTNLVGVDNPDRSLEELKSKSTPDANTFCSVCGSLSNNEMNCLLECNRCLIRVHQACYGISKVPKSHWYCRPCKENATNIVCVLCGYESGIMTRALQSSNIVKSLLNAWNVVTESLENPITPSRISDNQLIIDAPSGTQVSNELIKRSSMADMMVLNSVTIGTFDSTVKQWVHVVCGLWTPGTRCPNVDTMSAFDVSGACHPKGNVVCSLCKREGGCCIRCRVVDCAIHFHPWCAHQKGLLQSEVEGVDNDKVGFYGRCELHATKDHCNCDTKSCSQQTIHTHEKDTCARTEGYKGRKREGFRHDSHQISSGTGGCLVPQEQVDAWNHINRQMSSEKRRQKAPIRPVQDVEYDCKKEYARYKHSKGWKHLVVYKSGIHALGLYTSLFISQGAMVVEYVGEIVGLRVADRRENEYQSGKKLQYKSACYFFKIDKEHIIDATRKGGIARFVNHSCEPNCAAKVITVRGEKKVVFFAERDIYPGEEITYDYHFSNEDEGKKIWCSCNSNNCRRYLN